MQFCQAHWDALRQAIDARGLSRLIAKDSHAAAQEAKEQLEGTTDPTQAPDPLMAAHWMIVNQALRIGGLGLMSDEFCAVCNTEEGHCPLCEVEYSAGSGSAKKWIDGCTEEVADQYREKGWMTND